MLNDGIHTLAYFHKKCDKNENKKNNNHDNEKW